LLLASDVFTTLLCHSLLLSVLLSALPAFFFHHAISSAINIVSSQRMAKYAHDTIVPFKESDQSKKQQVATMFDKIAFRYDFLNRSYPPELTSVGERKRLKS
jgi:hypothetical protein